MIVLGRSAAGAELSEKVHPYPSPYYPTPPPPFPPSTENHMAPVQHSGRLAMIQGEARAVAQASWLYPFKVGRMTECSSGSISLTMRLQGIYYFFAHPFLYPLLRARLIPCLLLSLFVFTNLFLWTYLPQVMLLAVFHGRALAWVNGAFLVLGEGAAIVALLFEAFFIDETLVDMFDAVLINEGLADLVGGSRVLDLGGSNPVRVLGSPILPAVYSPFSIKQIMEFILLLPLNLIPLAGTPMFLLLTGYRAGPLHHHRYFKLLGVTKGERNRVVKGRRLRYTWFGTAALVLQLIPVLSMLFLLTTAAGSALWVVRLEKENRQREVGADYVPHDRRPYEDDPP